MNYEKLVGHANAIWLAYEYDLKFMIPLFMTCFETLNLNVKACTCTNHGEKLQNESNMFRVGASF
jgi:hypothetical protein